MAQPRNMPEVAVIVPAKDEAARIGSVLRAVMACKLATEVIAVSDGSTDETAQVAASVPGVRVLDLPRNLGKGGAMQAGVRATRAPIVAFVDADLDGLQPAHIDRIILPVVAGECEMCVGVFRGGRVFSDAAQRVSPYLSGQRAMRRELFESIPYVGELRMGVEVELNAAARRRRSRVVRVVLTGVSNAHKEKKMGLMKGLAARTKMYKEIGQTVMKRRKRRRGPKRPWI